MFGAHLAVIAIGPTMPVVADALFYDVSAQHLLDGRGFRAGPEPEVSLMPGYSFLLAGIYAVFGHRLWAVYFIQCMLIAISACGLFFIVRRNCGTRPAAIAFLALAFFPAWFIYPGVLNAETLLLAAQIGFFAVILRPSRTVAWAAGGGAACGLLTLIKPEFFLWLALPTILAGRGRLVRTAVVSAAVFSLVISPWAIRNALAFQQFIPLTTRSGRALWISAHEPELTEFTEPAFVAAEARCARPGNPKANDACLTAEAREMISQHPGYYFKSSLGRVFRTLVGSHTESLPVYSMAFRDAVHGRRFGILAVKGTLLIVDVLFVAGGILGVVLICRNRQYRFLLYLVATKLAVCAVFFGTARYGLHLSPIFATGWGALGFKLRHSSEASAVPAPGGGAVKDLQ